MNPDAILDAIDEAINDADGTDDESTVTLIACFLALRIPTTH